MLPNSIFKDQNFYYFLTFAIFAQLFKRLFAWCVLAYPRSVADASVKEEFAQADFKLRRVDTIMSPNKERHSGFCLSKVTLEVFQPLRRALYLPWLSLNEGVKTCVCKYFKHTCPDLWLLSSETGSFENVVNSEKQSCTIHPQTPCRALRPASPCGARV